MLLHDIVFAGADKAFLRFQFSDIVPCQRNARIYLSRFFQGQIDTGIPLTRNNIGELEAEESLVRASEQPLLPQQHVLLRPAAGMEETSAEHLLRPS